MKTKLTTTERRAVALCQSIRQACQNGGSYPLTVEWVKSATWGSNPRIMHRGEKSTNVSGCGYCKHSTALADALCHLGETEEARHAIARTGGAGVSTVQARLKEYGWILEYVTAGKAFDCYTIRKA